MIFSRKEVTVAYTVEGCGSCGRSSRREYRDGDVLFAGAGPCSCGGGLRIEMIYGETTKR